MVHCYLFRRCMHHMWNTFLLRLGYLSPEACRDFNWLRHLPNLDLNRKVFLKHRIVVHDYKNHWSGCTTNRKSNFWNPSHNDWISVTWDDYFLRLQRGFWELRYLFLYSYRFAMWRHGL